MEPAQPQAPERRRRASMRPRRARLGWLGRANFGQGHVLSASMRPRRARLGWAARMFPVSFRVHKASMRPRRARLGWQRCCPRPPASGWCFNEAEARTPRMVTCGPREIPEGMKASMRPRRARLGWARGDRLSRFPRMRASMRPRRARLGWARDHLEGAPGLPDASMRPRRARLGWGGGRASEIFHRALLQ